MSELWRKLRVGDCIRISRFPVEFSQPRYHLHEETRRLYEHLVAKQHVLTVDKIDECGLPWIEYMWVTEGGSEEYHSLAVNHEGLELVD